MAQTHRGPPPHETAEERADREAREAEEQRRLQAQHDEEEARRQAEAATAHLPRQGDPKRRPMTGAEAKAPGEATVKMNFPHPVTLTLTGYRTVHFPAGVQEVPESMIDEPYLADNRVTKV